MAIFHRRIFYNVTSRDTEYVDTAAACHSSKQVIVRCCWMLGSEVRGDGSRRRRSRCRTQQHSSPPGFCDGGRGDDDATDDDDDDNIDDDEEIERADSMPAVSH